MYVDCISVSWFILVGEFVSKNDFTKIYVQIPNCEMDIIDTSPAPFASTSGGWHPGKSIYINAG